MATTMNPINPSNPPNMDQKPPIPPSPGVLNSVPAWGSYLYQNFLLPAFSPSEWLNSNTPGGLSLNPTDYFGNQPASTATTSGSSYLQNILPSRSSNNNLPYSQQQQTQQQHQQQQQQHQHQQHQQAQAGPSNYYTQQSYFSGPAPSAIPTSLLHSHSSSNISPSVEIIDNLVRSPSPISNQITPHGSPKRTSAKRRASSMDSADSHDDELQPGEHDIAEGVERDGIIWGMKVEDYRALSARERKRVRNRISARTFRAKRKEHLSSLETDLSSKDIQIKAANDEAARLRRQVADLTARLSKYEKV